MMTDLSSEVWIMVAVVIIAIGLVTYFSLRALKAQARYDAGTKKLSAFLESMTPRRNVKTIDSDVKKLRHEIENLSGDMSSIMLRQFRAALKGIKGELGEWVVGQQIQSQYDKVVYLGGNKPIDFLGISKNGIDFIEVKTGKKAKLDEAEELIRQHIQAGRINYRLIHVPTPIPPALDEKAEAELLAEVEHRLSAMGDSPPSKTPQKEKQPLAANEGFCASCRGPREIKNGSTKVLKNGTRLLQGKCVECGRTLTRFLAKENSGTGA